MSTTTASAAKSTHYKEVYFNHTTLRKVTGNPTYNELQSLYKQFKANAASVTSTLGGFRQVHLGLVTNAITYVYIAPDNPFVRSVNPASLGDNNTGIAAKIAENLGSHNLSITHFHQANHDERTMVNQIQEALDNTVLMPKIMGIEEFLGVP